MAKNIFFVFNINKRDIPTMQINKLNNISFKANYFTVEKRGKYYSLEKISTDNSEKLGKEPVLQTKMQGVDCEFPMIYDGKYYTTELPSTIEKYRVFYKDTGKYEKNGKEQKINPLDLTKIVITEERKFNNLPPEQSFVKGEVSGKVFVNTFDIPKNVPAILILDEVKDEETLILDIPHNVRGVITSSCDFGVLSHVANLTRNNISSMSIVWDGDKYNNLKNLNGKYISLNNESGILEYKEIEPEAAVAKSQTFEKIEAPKLENVERLLNFNELTPQNCGNKGYRISIMQKLVNEGKLKDITVPSGFVIPEGYLNKYKEYVNVEDIEESIRRDIEGVYTSEVENKVIELGLPRRSLIIRSNFNTEDMGSFSSAGIYISNYAANSPAAAFLMREGYDVARVSLDEEVNPISKIVHEKHGIKEKDVQPSVIIQERIHPDYEFTVYSEDGDNNVIFDFSDCKMGYLKPENALIKYNKKTKELKLERKQSPIADFLLNEKGEVIDQKHMPDRIDENWDILKPILGIVASGALVLENFFKHPQDVEGGIKDGKVYFWQTRDIVAKAVKRI